MFLPGEVTQDELFNRLQQIKDGPEQQNNTAGTESVEDPVGMFDISLYIVFFFFFFPSFFDCAFMSEYDFSLANSAHFQNNRKAQRILPVVIVCLTG